MGYMITPNVVIIKLFNLEQEYCGMEIGFGKGEKMVVRWFHILSSIKIGIKHAFIYCGFF
jgi:hypothetical protein